MINRLTDYERPKLPPAAWRAAGQPAQPDWQDRAYALMGDTTRWVREHPEMALGAAIATGVLLGWLIKRR